jgi:hypothetical protein
VNEKSRFAKMVAWVHASSSSEVLILSYEWCGEFDELVRVVRAI